MKDLFAEKKGKVIIIEGAGPIRTQVSESLRAIGFNDIVGVPEVKDALGILETEPVSWILTCLLSEKSENGFQLLKLIIDNAALRNTKLSLTLEENETYVLPHAFSMGMLSWHKKPFTKDSIEKELNVLLERAQNCEYNSTLLSALYLREHLKEIGAYADLLNFERELIKVYPNNLSLFLNLVEPTIKVAGIDQAKPILRMVKAVNPALTPQVEQVMGQFLAGQTLDDTGETANLGFNFLGLNRVVVVDADESVHNQLRELFTSMGTKEVECFASGVSALEYLKGKPDPDLIVQEWKLPQLSGPAFLQHVKSELAVATPVIVMSSLLRKEDVPFVREMGIAATAIKPLVKDDLIRTLTFTMQQEHAPTDQSAMERKIRTLLAQKKKAEAIAIKEKFMADPKVSAGAKALIEAEFAYVSKDFAGARVKAIDAIKYAGDSIFSLNLLGKILLSLGETTLSLRCFDKAQAIAPLNIDRICSIAELQAGEGQTVEAHESLDKANTLEPGGDRVMQATAAVALQSGDIKTARKIMGEIPAIERVIAVMNNSAVALINALRYDEALTKYQVTLEAIPDKRNDLRAVVLYNLSLAYARDGRLEDAVTSLDQSLKEEFEKMKPKAAALKKKVSMIIKMGGNLNLVPPGGAAAQGAVGTLEEQISDGDAPKAANPVVDTNSSEDSMTVREISSLLTIQRGEIGCYMVYQPAKRDERTNKLLQGIPRFVVRQAIAREESHGVDKLAQRRGKK